MYGLNLPGILSATSYQNLQRVSDLYHPRNGAVDFYDGGKTDFGKFATADLAAAFQLRTERSCSIRRRLFRG